MSWKKLFAVLVVLVALQCLVWLRSAIGLGRVSEVSPHTGKEETGGAVPCTGRSVQNAGYKIYLVKAGESG